MKKIEGNMTSLVYYESNFIDLVDTKNLQSSPIRSCRICHHTSEESLEYMVRDLQNAYHCSDLKVRKHVKSTGGDAPGKLDA